MARFPQEGVRKGGPNPQEFITKITQELQESRVMRDNCRVPSVAPHPGEDGRLRVCIDYPGFNRVASQEAPRQDLRPSKGRLPLSHGEVRLAPSSGKA